MTKPLVYVAGKLNADLVDGIKNANWMMSWAETIRLAGCAVYVPCTDILMGLMFGNYDYDDYFNNSVAFLGRCDAMFVCPGWETSKGVKREITEAGLYDVPVYYKLTTLYTALGVGHQDAR